jgi:hypothetical protein
MPTDSPELGGPGTAERLSTVEPGDADPGRSWSGLRGSIGRAAALIIVAVVIWAGLWSVERPRAGYDTLWYSMYTYQYGGASAPESWDRSWNLVVQYGPSFLIQELHREPNGAWFVGFDDPKRQRWIGIYRMRPVMPLLGAVAYPVLGTSAPLVASVAAVIVVVLVAALVIPAITGWLIAAIFLLLTVANPLVAKWLVYLTPDGLGLAFWLLTLALVARYVRNGGRWWLAGATGATLLLAFTRPSAILIPLTLAICAAASLIAGRGPWRRLAIVAAVTTVPILVFTAYAVVAGLPTFLDQLQDLPTHHFVDKDLTLRALASYFIKHDLALAVSLPLTLPGQPLVLLSLVGAGLGFFLTRQWWMAPFVAALLTVPLLVAVHPVSTEVARTLTPGWISLNLGLALLAATVIARIRARILTRASPARA